MSKERRKKSKKRQKNLPSDSSSLKKKQKHSGRKMSSSKKSSKKNTRHQTELATWRKVMNFLFNLLFYAVTIGLILSAVLFAFNDKEDKSIFGYQVFNVRTNSMVPRDTAKQKGGFRAGDVIIIKKIRGSEVVKGDIVTFHPNKNSATYLTHRVVKVVEELNGLPGPYMITQGDANLTEDAPTPVNQVVGKKILSIPKLGLLLQFIREHVVVTIVFLISLFGSILLLKTYLGYPEKKTERTSAGKTSKKSIKRS